MIALFLTLDGAYAAESERDFSKSNAWFYGLLSTIGVGAVGFLCSAIVVLIKAKTKINMKPTTKVLIAIAAGALIGDAFVHLIPIGFGAHGHEDEHAAEEEEDHDEHADEEEEHHEDEEEEDHEDHEDHDAHEEEEEELKPTILSLMLLLGLVTFYLIERAMHMCGLGHSHDGDGEESEHSHDNKNEEKQKLKQQQIEIVKMDGLDTEQAIAGVEKKEFESDTYLQKKQQSSSNNDLQINAVQAENNQHIPENNKVPKVHPISSDKNIPALDSIENGKSQVETQRSSSQSSTEGKSWVVDLKSKKSEGYLNLIGDFFHNILDGIAIGAIFSTGVTSTSVSTLVAILAHEIPQEIGDVGILLHSGFSNCQILTLNGLVNFSALIGTIIGLLLGEMGEKTEKYLTLFIAGNFIYIGACDMFPLIKKEKDNKMMLLQFFGLIFGIGLMYVVLLFESEDEH